MVLNECERSLGGRDGSLPQLIAEHSPAGVMVVRQGKFDYVNPALARMFGYSVDELVNGLGPEDLAEPADRPRLLDIRQRWAKGDLRPLRTVFHARRKDGSSFTCEVIAQALRSEGAMLLIGTLIDVTDRERIREQAQRRERLLRGILTNSADGIVLIDEYAVIQEWNPGQERITGIARDEVEGETLFDVLFRLTPADQRTIEAYIQSKGRITEYLQNEQAPDFGRPVQSEIVRPDGRTRELETLYFSVRQNGDQKVACITRDVTERRMLERAEMEAVRTREQFISSVTEGLRRPLADLVDDLNLSQPASGAPPERREAALARAQRAAESMADLVDGLRQAAEFESGVELAMEEVDLRRIIQQAMESVKAQAAEKGIPVAYTPDPAAPTVRANGARLLQAVLSLIRNAIRMSDTGSPVIVTAIARNGEVTVQVTDQGPGIPRSAEPAVFAKRAPGLLPGEEGDESGDLELYLSRKIIEAHGGQMGVRSQLGVGSTFYFSLPAAAEYSG